MTFHKIQELEVYLQKYIPSPTLVRFPGNEGIIRTKEFLKLLGSPQNKCKVVHIAGTSGKGSTSFMISSMLRSLGYRVGLHLSPHLLDIRERSLINNNILDEQKYISYFEEIMPAIEKMSQSAFGKITYFEAMVGFVYYIFAKEKVEYAVIETGLGGEFDGTNVVTRKDKLAVLSRIGFDHMKVLGNSLPEIAHQKAMICMSGGELISIYQFPTALKEIQAVVNKKKGTLLLVEKNNIRDVQLTQNNTIFSFKWGVYEFKNLNMGLLGDHQVQNAALALATICHLAKRDRFEIDIKKITSSLRNLRFKGRFDIIGKKRGQIILDGAHNVPKMKALLKTLKKLYPNNKFTFVVAFKKGKEYKKMIQLIIPHAKKMIITHIFSNSQDLLHFSVSPKDIIEEIRKLGFSHSTVMNDIQKIIQMMKNDDDSYVVSGSLYLLGDIYNSLK